MRPEMAAADHYSGFAIGLIVIFMGVRVVRETALQLMDTMPDPAQMDQIRRAALGVEGAIAIEKCFARKTGLRFHVDLHLEVDPNLTVSESHEIAGAVKTAVKTHVPGWRTCWCVSRTGCGRPRLQSNGKWKIARSHGCWRRRPT